MKKNDGERQSFRVRIFNRRLIFAIALLVILVGAGGGIYMMKAGDHPAFCATCHIMRSYYDSWNDSNLLVNKHAEEGLECHDCHEPSLSTQLEEGIKYITGNYQTPLEKREFSQEFCLKCHDDMESVKDATDFEESNPHDSHLGEQECNLCHNMHQQSQVMCAECHFFDWIDDLDDSWVTDEVKNN